jgi:hypothetical protein
MDTHSCVDLNVERLLRSTHALDRAVRKGDASEGERVVVAQAICNGSNSCTDISMTASEQGKV